MRKRHLLITALALGGPLFCLAACGGGSQPSLSSVSISVGPVVSDPQAEEAKFEDFSLFYVPEVGGYLIGDYKGSLTSITIPYNATGDDGIIHLGSIARVNPNLRMVVNIAGGQATTSLDRHFV